MQLGLASAERQECHTLCLSAFLVKKKIKIKKLDYREEQEALGGGKNEIQPPVLGQPGMAGTVRGQAERQGGDSEDIGKDREGGREGQWKKQGRD